MRKPSFALRTKSLRAENEKLLAKLQRKDSVLSELMEDHIALKKSLGED